MDKDPRGIIYKKGGYYYARIYYYQEGKRKTKDKATGIAVEHASARKAKQQERAANLFLDQYLQGFSFPGTVSVPPATEQMLADTADAWFNHIHGAKAPGTLSGYAYSMRDIKLYFAEILPVRTADLTSRQVESYLAWERHRRQPDYDGQYKVCSRSKDGTGIENTVDHRYKVLSSILQYAKREGIVPRNVASKRDCQISVPQPQRQEFPVLTKQEAIQLLQMLSCEDQWFRVAVTLGLIFGLRRSEIIGIRASDIDRSNGTLTISRTVTQQTINHKNTITAKPYTKNRKSKVFVLAAEVTEMLSMLITENQHNKETFGAAYDTSWDDYLFRYADGRLISPNTLTRKFAEFIDEHKLKDIRLHDLRHSCASILYANGTDLLTIQEILGHAQLTTTIMYTHQISDRKTAALTQMTDQVLTPVTNKKVEEEN